MVDQIYDRSFQAGRAKFNDGLLAFIAGIRDALTPVLASLHRIEWDAPWETKADPRAKA